MAAAETTSEMCGLAKAMDSLWFFPKSPPPEITKTPLPASEPPGYSSSSPDSSRSHISVSSHESDGDKRRRTRGSRPSRSVLVSGKPRCHSSSPSIASARRSKRRSKSCESHGEAELEEVKGIVDLGFFDFKGEEKLSEDLVRLIPGLRRIDDAPLMDLRASDVKRRLKWWARTVALAAQPDSYILGDIC